MKELTTLLLIILLLSSCGQSEKKSREIEKEPILLADREAPLGWVYLRIYSDSTFEFESRGLRTSSIYPGKAVIIADSIFFEYSRRKLPPIELLNFQSKSIRWCVYLLLGFAIWFLRIPEDVQFIYFEF